MNRIDFLLLEAEDEEVEDIDMEAEEKAIENDMNEDDKPETEENTEDNTKQNNNEEESDGETDGVDTPDEEVDTTGDNPESDINDSEESEEQPDEEVELEEDEMSKAKRLFFYNNFESLFNTTLNFIDKLEYIRETESDEKKKDTLVELENKLLKQKNDINFLLKKKIMNTSEENLNKLLLYFSTKTETIIDITKSLIKEAN